jgi:hypothetical protein
LGGKHDSCGKKNRIIIIPDIGKPNLVYLWPLGRKMWFINVLVWFDVANEVGR